MAFDAHKNLAISAVATAPTPATSGTSLVVTAGHGARFPAAPFNVTIWPATAPPDPTNAEVARVTARATDTLTIQRAQEGSTARLVGVGDLIAQTITAKTLTDLETQAALTAAANVFVTPQRIEGTYPTLQLSDPGLAVNTRMWTVLNATDLFLQAANDAGVSLVNALQVSRAGSVRVAADITEKGRVAPLGHWTTGDASSYAQTAGFTGAYWWSVIGKTLHLVMNASGPVAASAAHRFTLPGGYTSAIGFSTPVTLYANQVGFAHFAPSGNFFDVVQVGSVAFPAGATTIQLSFNVPLP